MSLGRLSRTDGINDALNPPDTATTDITKVIPDCDVVILSLPTPMDDQNVPDYSALLSVGKSLNSLLSNGQLVIVPSNSLLFGYQLMQQAAMNYNRILFC